MSKGYGTWQRPAFGKMHTRPWPRDHSSVFATPREGSGDFRPPTAIAKGSGNRRPGKSPASPSHNPYRVVIDMPYRDPRGEAEYIPVRNGVPEFRPYTWRAAGCEKRLARFRLDLAVLAAADWQVEQEISQKDHDFYRPNARKYKPRRERAEVLRHKAETGAAGDGRITRSAS